MKKIKKGDRIILKTVNGPKPLNFNQNIEMQVMWVLDHQFLRNVGYGCMFLNLPQEKAELIRIMVADYVLDTKDGADSSLRVRIPPPLKWDIFSVSLLFPCSIPPKSNYNNYSILIFPGTSHFFPGTPGKPHYC